MDVQTSCKNYIQLGGKHTHLFKHKYRWKTKYHNKILKKSYKFQIQYTQNIDSRFLWPYTGWMWCVAITGIHYYNTRSSLPRRLYCILSSLVQYFSKKIHLWSNLDTLWAKTGYFGLLGNNHILFIILSYLIEG